MTRFQREVDDLKKELIRARQPLDVVKAVQDQMDMLEDQTDLPVVPLIERRSSGDRFHPGSKVFLLSLNMNGIITSLTESDAEVQVGNLRIRAKLSDLIRPDEQPEAVIPERKKRKAATEPTTQPEDAPRQSPGMELDIRGQRAEDGLSMLDRYLEQAFLSGLPFVRIIHGKGTGRLRQVIREALKENPHVKKWESGMDNEGGDGVTVAHLRQD